MGVTRGGKQRDALIEINRDNDTHTHTDKVANSNNRCRQDKMEEGTFTPARQ